MVLEPDSLREDIRTEAERIAKQYERTLIAEESQPYDCQSHDHLLKLS